MGQHTEGCISVLTERLDTITSKLPSKFNTK